MHRAEALAALATSIAQQHGQGSSGTGPQVMVAIHGDKDPIVPVANAEYFARSIPGAEVRVLGGMGHILCPEVCAQILAVFFKDALRLTPPAKLIEAGVAAPAAGESRIRSHTHKGPHTATAQQRRAI